MSQVAREAQKRRRRKAKNRKTPGKIIRHSDIVNRKETVQGIATTQPAEEHRGGYKSVVVSNKSFTISTFYIPQDSATGDFEVKGGHQTLIIQSGQVFFSTRIKGKKKEAPKAENGRLGAGESFTVSKGMTARFTTGHIPTSCLMIESSDFEALQKTPPIDMSTGLNQYRNIRKTSGEDASTRPARKPKTKEEREALGLKYLRSRGVNTPAQVKQNKRKKQQNAGNNSEPAVIIGSNPKPIGDID